MLGNLCKQEFKGEEETVTIIASASSIMLFVRQEGTKVRKNESIDYTGLAQNLGLSVYNI